MPLLAHLEHLVSYNGMGLAKVARHFPSAGPLHPSRTSHWPPFCLGPLSAAHPVTSNTPSPPSAGVRAQLPVRGAAHRWPGEKIPVGGGAGARSGRLGFAGGVCVCQRLVCGESRRLRRREGGAS
jgi:hypothetical protein